jgi:hypothetical protein
MTDLVTDLPIWTDCPFKVPPHIEVRRGATAEFGDTAVFWDASRKKNVALRPDGLGQYDVDLAIDLLEVL